MTRRLHVAEPPAGYRLRPPIVVDCSVLAGILFQEPWRDQALARIGGHALHAPWLLQTELASVAFKKHRQGFAEIATAGLSHFADLALDLHAIDPVAVSSLADQYRLSAYDAAYLWLAADLKAPLATFDEQLGRAAQGHLSALPDPGR